MSLEKEIKKNKIQIEYCLFYIYIFLSCVYFVARESVLGKLCKKKKNEVQNAEKNNKTSKNKASEKFKALIVKEIDENKSEMQKDMK